MIGKKIKVCKDQENATLVLYRNICNTWYKNVILINSYTQHLCDGQIYILLVHLTCVHDGS